MAPLVAYSVTSSSSPSQGLGLVRPSGAALGQRGGHSCSSSAICVDLLGLVDIGVLLHAGVSEVLEPVWFELGFGDLAAAPHHDRGFLSLVPRSTVIWAPPNVARRAGRAKHDDFETVWHLHDASSTVTARHGDLDFSGDKYGRCAPSSGPRYTETRPQLKTSSTPARFFILQGSITGARRLWSGASPPEGRIGVPLARNGARRAHGTRFLPAAAARMPAA